MGEILLQLKEQKAALERKKSQMATYDPTALNARIARLNTIITKIEQGGWDS